MASEWPVTRWQLTAPESYVLLNDPHPSASQAFKLGVMELVARGVLVLDTATQGRLRRHRVSRLRDGPRARAPREHALEAIWKIYQRAPSHMYDDGQRGTRVEIVAKAAARQYGKIARYLTEAVFPALIERSLYERKERRILWIFPITSFVLTTEGQLARSELEQLLAVGQEQFVGWSMNDPNRAVDYATVAGAALLLQPELFPYMRRPHQTLDPTSPTAADRFSPLDDLDTSGFDFSTFDVGDGFDAAMSAINSAIDSAVVGDGGGDGGGGNGGGGGDGGGGNGGGGGDGS